jgi:rhodanese-related sulfurtransferase
MKAARFVRPLRLVELKDLKGGPVLLVCRTDKRSAKAAAVLTENGFSAEVLVGGMEQWKSR